MTKHNKENNRGGAHVRRTTNGSSHDDARPPVVKTEQHYCNWCETGTEHDNISRVTEGGYKGMLLSAHCTVCGAYNTGTD